MNKYYVYMRTVPGMFTQYDGRVEVYAENDDQAIERAFHKLKKGAFPDYSRGMWKVEKVERSFD